MVHASACAVVANTFEDLEAWRIADELKREVYPLIATGPVSKDFKFCNQIRESAASPTRNIAEGFGRFRPGPFAQFMEIAIGSTMETQNSLKDGIDRGYFTVESIARASELARRYYESISAPAKGWVLLQHSGHDPNQEVVDAEYKLLRERVLPLTVK